MPIAFRSLTTACTAGSDKSTVDVALDRGGLCGAGVGESRGAKGDAGEGLWLAADECLPKRFPSPNRE